MSQEKMKSATALTTARKSVVDLDGFSGFTDEAEGADDVIDTSSRVIIGQKLKFNDPRWLIGDVDVSGTLLTAFDVRRVVNKWSVDGKPLVTQILPPGEPWPDFKKLNEECPRSEWRPYYNGERGPWSGQNCLYLADENWTRYTWPSSLYTAGACVCVCELVDHIKFYRQRRGEGACPVVKLSHTLFSKTYKRNRADLPVQRWIMVGAERQELPAADTAVLASNTGAPADAQTIEPITLAEEMDDKVKF